MKNKILFFAIRDTLVTNLTPVLFIVAINKFLRVLSIKKITLLIASATAVFYILGFLHLEILIVFLFHLALVFVFISLSLFILSGSTMESSKLEYSISNSATYLLFITFVYLLCYLFFPFENYTIYNKIIFLLSVGTIYITIFTLSADFFVISIYSLIKK